MLSVARDRPVDPLAIAILKQVDPVARALGIEYLVTGATARDILLVGVFGLETGRGTRDVDLAIAVDGWPQFEMVKTRLVETGTFEADDRVTHRLFHLPGKGRRGYPIDLIPFGGIEDPAATIAWPPDRSIVMNVAGYREAFEAASLVEIDPGFVVRVVSLPGLAILKLFAWADRGAGDPRDAIDLAMLLRQYGAAGNEDRLYGAEIGVMEASSYDLDLADARLLGQDAARISGTETRTRLLGSLDEERMEQLARAMARQMGAAADPVAAARALIGQLVAGLRDI
ncbi:MAG: nucleotidyl transferase AbiEii/AbiGii toxin family protein [Candidatus Rokuibacteriota bacterium]